MGKLIEGVFSMKEEEVITTIDLVSDYFLSKQKVTNKKLQKMCYYAYSWYLTLYDKHLFDDGKFEAWVHGPVNPKLYNKYKAFGWRIINETVTVSSQLSSELKDFLDMIYNTFSNYSGDELENMTHQEAPWIEARKGISSEIPSNQIINDNTIKSFYSNLMVQGQLE